MSREQRARRTLGVVAIALTLILAVSLAARADTDGCLTVRIEHDNGQERITETELENLEEGEIRYALVGYYVWLQWGHKDNPDPTVDVVSFDVSDPSITAVRACLDGSVELIQKADTTPGHPAHQPEITLPSIDDWCVRYADIIALYCTLPNLGVTVVIE